MSTEITQDSAAIKKIGDDLVREGNEFIRIVGELFDEMNNQIGADESHQAWYGPKAQAFMSNVNKKRTDFDNAGKNIISMGQNLINQGDSWDKFENS